MYSLAWETPVFDGRLKAPHALDLPFVFDNTEVAEATAGAAGGRDLAAVMSASWAAFARTGSPAITGLPDWPAYTADARSVMIFDRECRTVSDPDRAHHAGLERLDQFGLSDRNDTAACGGDDIDAANDGPAERDAENEETVGLEIDRQARRQRVALDRDEEDNAHDQHYQRSPSEQNSLRHGE